MGEVSAKRTNEEGQPEFSVRAVRRIPLSLGAFPIIRGNELYVALSALQRMCDLWESSTAGQWVTLDFGAPARDLYAQLYWDMFVVLESREDLATLTGDVKQLVPDSMPDSDLALIMDDVLKGHYLDEFTQARRILTNALFASGGAPWENPAEILFDIFDAEIAHYREAAVRSSKEFGARLGLVGTRDEEVSKPKKSRTGRTRNYDKDALIRSVCEFLTRYPAGICREFQIYAGITPRTWSRYTSATEGYGLTWSELKQMCQKENSKESA